MPTGYTNDVQTGAITEFPEFAKRCARAMGALVMMRDEPMDAPIKVPEPTDYHQRAIRDANERLLSLRSMTHAEVVEAWREASDEAYRRRQEFTERRDTERRRYEAMLEKVEAWDPPSTDHVGLKEFMVGQLRESIKFDCGGSWVPDLVEPDPDKWWQAQVKEAERSLVYHKNEDRKERERTAERVKWIDELLASLDGECRGGER